MKRSSDIVMLLSALLPPAVWFVCFSLLYGVVTLACGPGLLRGGGRNVSLMLMAAALVVLAVIGIRAVRTHQFLTIVSRGLSVLAIIATLWLLVPLVVLGPC